MYSTELKYIIKLHNVKKKLIKFKYMKLPSQTYCWTVEKNVFKILLSNKPSLNFLSNRSIDLWSMFCGHKAILDNTFWAASHQVLLIFRACIGVRKIYGRVESVLCELSQSIQVVTLSPCMLTYKLVDNFDTDSEPPLLIFQFSALD